jgi:hypothetical protein
MSNIMGMSNIEVNYPTCIYRLYKELKGKILINIIFRKIMPVANIVSF